MRWVWFAGLGAAWLFSCSGESATGDDDSGDAAGWATACDEAADVFCSKYEECAPILQGLIPTDCHGFYQSSCLSSATLPGANITPSQYSSCVNAFERLSCDDWLYNGETPPECRNIPGERGVGDPCGSGLQCVSGACTGGGECGVCEVRAAEGESCLERECDVGLVCGTENICRPRTKLGDPCSPDAPCDLVMPCRGGVCSKPPGDGEPCATEGLSCDLFQLLTCSPTTMLCESESVPGIGEACTDRCAGGAVCSPTTGTCIPPIAAGLGCSPDGERPCDATLECVDGICRPFDPTTCD